MAEEFAFKGTIELLDRAADAPDDSPTSFRAVIARRNQVDDRGNIVQPEAVQHQVGQPVRLVAWQHKHGDPNKWGPSVGAGTIAIEGDEAVVRGTIHDEGFEKVARAEAQYGLGQISVGSNFNRRDILPMDRLDRSVRGIPGVKRQIAKIHVGEVAYVWEGGLSGTKLELDRESDETQASIDALRQRLAGIDPQSLTKEAN